MESKNPMATIQAMVKAPKNQFNSFGKYAYRSAEDIVEAVKPIINPLGFHLTLSDEVILVGERYYIKSTASISNGQLTFSASAFAREEFDKKGMDTAQISGSTGSYSRKYALNGLFALDDTKDPDATNTHGKDQKKVQNEVAKPIEPKIELAEFQEIQTIVNGCINIAQLTELWADMEDYYKVIPSVKVLFTNKKTQLTK
jgi:hypothetical protein